MINITLNDVVKCAKKLENNSPNIYIKEELQHFINHPSCDNFLYRIIEFIIQDGYDISDYGLYEIPHPQVFCFYNVKNDDKFDICIDNFNRNGKEISAAFVNNYSDEEDAENISDAINRFFCH